MALAFQALVASSDSEVCRALTRILGRHGVEPVFSSTAEEAKAALVRGPISLVFCEERLSDGSFRDVLGEVKRSARLVPLVVVSRLGDWDKCLEALCLGVHDYVAYPFQGAEIESVIHQALNTMSVFA